MTVARRMTWVFPMLLALLCSLIGAESVAAAEDNRHFNLDGDGYAIERYDPVAYFTQGKAVKGDSAHTAVYQGANYAFASDEHRQLFLSEPEKYLPQYDGYCAYGAVYGSKSSIDPEVWEIVDGRLYFLINPGTMTLWQKRKDIYIKIADKAWKTLTGSP